MSDRTSILVIDDDLSIRKLMERILPRFGYEPILCKDGPSGLQALVDVPDIAAVVLDWMMPGMDGLEVMQAIRALDDAPPVLMLSAKSRREEVVLAIQAGVRDYVTKPPNIGDLIMRINRLVEQHRREEPSTGREATLDLRARAALTVVDVSQTGLCLEASFPLERGVVMMMTAAELSRRLELSPDTTFAIRVANCRKAGRHYRIGGEFIGHDADLDRRIRKASLAAGGFRVKS